MGPLPFDSEHQKKAQKTKAIDDQKTFKVKMIQLINRCGLFALNTYQEKMIMVQRNFRIIFS